MHVGNTGVAHPLNVALAGGVIAIVLAWFITPLMAAVVAALM